MMLRWKSQYLIKILTTNMMSEICSTSLWTTQYEIPWHAEAKEDIVAACEDYNERVLRYVTEYPILARTISNNLLHPVCLSLQQRVKNCIASGLILPSGFWLRGIHLPFYGNGPTGEVLTMRPLFTRLRSILLTMCWCLGLPKYSHGYSIIAHVSNGHRACSSLAATQGACVRHPLFANSLRSTRKVFAKKIDCAKRRNASSFLYYQRPRRMRCRPLPMDGRTKAKY